MNGALPKAVIMEEPDPLIEKIIEIMGVDGIIEAVGVDAIIEAVGVDTFIEILGVENIFNHIANHGTFQQRQCLFERIKEYLGQAR